MIVATNSNLRKSIAFLIGIFGAYAALRATTPHLGIESYFNWICISLLCLRTLHLLRLD